MVVPRITRDDVLQEQILSQIEQGTKIYTDEATVYKSLPKEYSHEFVNHMVKYVMEKFTPTG